MKQEEKRVLEVRLEGEEVDTFKSLLKKVDEQARIAGFGYFRLDDKEKDLVKELNK